MDFVDVVMKRRAVRRFEEGGVEGDVIERIARLAQRAPSGGFSQGQRLIVVTEPERRREIARICGEEDYLDDFGPWISECAAQFIPCVSEQIYHRRYQEPDKIQEDGTEIDWPIPYWWVDIGATMQNIWLAAVNEGLGCGFVGTDELPALKAALGLPDEFTPIGVMPVGRPVPDVRSPSLKRGWVPFDEFARWERWENREILASLPRGAARDRQVPVIARRRPALPPSISARLMGAAQRGRSGPDRAGD